MWILDFYVCIRQHIGRKCNEMLLYVKKVAWWPVSVSFHRNRWPGGGLLVAWGGLVGITRINRSMMTDIRMITQSDQIILKKNQDSIFITPWSKLNYN